jgi:hypothetical protein
VFMWCSRTFRVCSGSTDSSEEKYIQNLDQHVSVPP